MPVRCENCGDTVADHERFCPTCGIPLLPAQPSTAADEPIVVHSTHPSIRKKRIISLPTVLTALLIVALLVTLLFFLFKDSALCSGKRRVYSRDTGYYNYQDTYYYNQGGSWYQYDEALGWILADPSEDFLEHYGSYYEGFYQAEDAGVDSFRDSEFYDPNAGVVEIDDNSKADGVQDGFYDNDHDADGDW